MRKTKKIYRHDLLDLDKFLLLDCDPITASNQIDTMMNDLVYISRNEPDFAEKLSDHYCLLLSLRNLLKNVSRVDTIVAPTKNKLHPTKKVSSSRLQQKRRIRPSAKKKL